MIHAKIAPPLRTPLRRKIQSSSDKILTRSAKIIQQDEEAIPIELKHPVPKRCSNLHKQGQAQIEIAKMSKRKTSYLIAPDGFIPNSTFLPVFKRKQIKPVEAKVFKLRWDILDNLPNKDHDDDELVELTDPDALSKSTNAKKSKGTLVSDQTVPDDVLSEDMIHNKYWNKDAMPDLFKRMQAESWWKQAKDEKPNLRSMLIYLKEIIQLKQSDSYESVCYYVIEIFRTYGIEPIFLNQILDILLNHLLENGNDPLDICTIRTIAQFMMERKDVIIRLLEYVLEYEPSDTFRQEVVNAIKFITDVHNSDEIDLVLDNISVVHDFSDDNFSLKTIIKSMAPTVIPELDNEGEQNDGIHPLLTKISEERWFPRRNILITLDYVLDVIITKLPNATKTLFKTLITHLVQLHHVIGYSIEQFDRVSNALISLLSHNEADYRLIAATNLANLRKETKSIDIALLNSFINDSRILVRTECCDTLKILTGILSDTILKDCADAMSYLQTLPEENFSLENYLKEKHLSSIPLPSVDEQLHISTNEIEQSLITHQIEKNEDITTLISSPSPFLSTQLKSKQFSVTSSSEINENQNSITSHMPRFRQKKQPIPPIKNSISVQINKNRPSDLSNSTNMWDSYTNQNNNDESKYNFYCPTQGTLINDSIETIIEEHKQTVGFYRIQPNRHVLIPHKITIDHSFSDQSHITINQHLSHSSTNSFKSSLYSTTSMSLLDLNHNQHYLHEIESVQLLSSLVIRALQIHRQHARSIPGAFSADFTNILNVSQMQFNSSSIVHQRPTSRQYAHIQSNVQAKAIKEGINIRKAQNIEGTLSNLLQTKSSSTSNPSNSRQANITHGWLLVQLLKSQGIFYSENYLEKIIQFYPKFFPLLHTTIPKHLISIIRNDPLMKQVALIFSNKQNELNIENSSIKRSDTKPSIPITEDEHSLNSFDYLSLIHRDDHKKKFLPPIRNSKTRFPRDVLQSSFRDIEMNSTESSNNFVHEKSRSGLHKRQVYMNLMMSTNENMFDRHRSRQTTSFLPPVARVPICH